MTTRKNFPPRKQQRQEDAINRQAARDARSDADQLEILVDHGHGRCVEAQRLQRRIDE